MDIREYKDNIYNQFSRVGKVLSSPKRLELLDLLSQGPKSVELLAIETKMSVANTSKHLQALLEARLVYFRKEKNFVIYRLADEDVVDLLLAVKAIAEKQLAELNLLRREFIVKPDQLESISLEELIERMDSGNVVIIDVRPHEEYEAGHIEGAMSMPIHELNKHLMDLPRDQQIVAYCRGPYCVYATQAVEFLQSKGYKISRLEAGLHEWRKAQENQIH